MSNGTEVCCILGLCCPVNSIRQRNALIEAIKKQRPSMTQEQAAQAADRVLEKYQSFSEMSKTIDNV